MFVFPRTWHVGRRRRLRVYHRAPTSERHPRVPIFRLFIADVVINFESISHPVVRISCVVAFLVYFLIAVTTETTGVSHLSHFGGLVSVGRCRLTRCNPC